jgi:hypothetical protein
MNSNAVGSITEVRESGIAGFASHVVQALKQQELKIADSFQEGLRPDGLLLKMPDHITERFRVWEESFSSPEDLAKISEVKQKVTGMMDGTSEYVTSQVETKTKRVQLELAMKAVSKSTQGIQQLLSSQ